MGIHTCYFAYVSATFWPLYHVVSVDGGNIIIFLIVFCSFVPLLAMFFWTWVKK